MNLTCVQLNFERPFPDVSQTSQLFPVLTLQEVVDGLDAAAKDPRVRGIIATVGTQLTRPQCMARRGVVRVSSREVWQAARSWSCPWRRCRSCETHSRSFARPIRLLSAILKDLAVRRMSLSSFSEPCLTIVTHHLCNHHLYCLVAVGNNTDYYLATAFDQIVMQPSGWLNLTGVAMSATFLRGLFEKLEIEPRLLQRHEYKVRLL